MINIVEKNRMQGDDNKIQAKWHKGRLPFAGHRQKFAAISKGERSAYNTKMLQIKQNPGPPPVVHKNKFKYQDHQLHFHYIQNTQLPQAIVIYIHGVNAHGGGSGYLASIVTQRNPTVNFYAFDQLNFGRSGGPFRAEISSLEDTISQTETFVQFIQAKFKTKPKIFLSGISYGGSVCFKACIRKPEKYAGVIFLTPGIRNLAEEKPFLKILAKSIGFLFPRIRLYQEKYDNGTKYNMASMYRASPYVYSGGFVPGTVRVVINAIDEISQLYQNFSTPYILFQAGVDKIVDLFAPLDLEQCKSKDKTTVYCQNMWHSALDEQQMQGIAWMVAEWIKQRL